MTVDDPRSRLLSSAEDVFLRQGYGAAKLDDIAGRAGISKKTIYKMVSSKAELFAAVIFNAIEMEDFSRSLEGNGTSDLEQPLCAFLYAYARLALSQRGADADRLVMAEARQFPELSRAYFDSVDAAAVGPLIRWLEEHAAAGRINVPSPDRAARMLIAMVIADSLRSLTLGNQSAFEDSEIVAIVNEAVTIFFSGVLRVPSDHIP